MQKLTLWFMDDNAVRRAKVMVTIFILFSKWFFKVFAHTPDAASQADIDVFVTHNSAPGTMRAEFDIFEPSLRMQSKIENQPRLR
jgi:hypothetical protein